MKRKGLGSLITILVLAVGGLVYTFVSGNSPLLGLDLQGGVSAVFQPTEDVPEESLEQAIDIIRQRVDATGTAEPEITRQGDTIIVQIPGVDDPQRVLDLVGQTAELRFRPVCQATPLQAPEGQTPGSTTPTTPGGPTTSAPAGTATTTGGPPPTTATSATSDGAAPPEGGFVEGESASGLQTPPPTTAPAAPPATGPTAPPATAVPGAPPTTVPGGEPSQASGCQQPPQNVNNNGISRRRFDRNNPDAEVILPEVDPECEPDPDEPEKCWVSVYWLGPTALTGEALSGADAVLAGTQWVVNPTFRSGENGIDEFNQIAAVCNAGQPACPTTQLAIVLDGRVISAPQINEPSFERDSIQISGSFTEGSAKDLTTVLRYGALPFELEPQQTQTVSATIGEDALRAGLIAGFIGLTVSALFMIAYYRLLGLLAIGSLLIGTALLWTIIAYLGETQNLALTLAGVTGIIVSIGISLDSNVVYYEHLKEDVHNGRTLRSSVERSFDSAFTTIVKADLASIIGAALLYFLTVGAVRGFAFYLGLAAILDLVAFYFFMRPAATLLARGRMAHRPGLFGIPQPKPEADEATPAPEGAG